jgi:hypothetical protein
MQTVQLYTTTKLRRLLIPINKKKHVLILIRQEMGILVTTLISALHRRFGLPQLKTLHHISEKGISPYTT